MIRNLLAAIGFLALAMIGGAAVYATYWHDEDRPRRLPVSVSGLDLTSREGQRLLDLRVEAAIDRVCADDDGGGGGGGFAASRYDERTCRREARAGADPQIARAIDRAFERQRFADDSTPIAPEDYGDAAYGPAPIEPAPAYAPPPVVYAAPAAPALREKHTVITRTALRPRVRWVRTRHGLVKRVVHRRLVRKTVKTVYVR